MPSTSGTVDISGLTTGTTTESTPVCPEPVLENTDVQIADPSLEEVSGAAVSTLDPEVVWVIEDSANPATVTALSPGGTSLSSLSVSVSNTDWEDLATLRTDDGGLLFIGDIGDNAARRNEVTVLRVPEPDPHGPPTDIDPEVLTLRRREPADAEALLVDPLTNDIVIVTKSLDGTASVLVAANAATAANGSVVDLVDAGTLDIGLLSAVLAGDVAPGGGAVALRTPGDVLWWPRDPSRSVADTLLKTQSCRLPAVVDPFGEALALTDGGYVITGEGENPGLLRAD